MTAPTSRPSGAPHPKTQFYETGPIPQRPRRWIMPLALGVQLAVLVTSLGTVAAAASIWLCLSVIWSAGYLMHRLALAK